MTDSNNDIKWLEAQQPPVAPPDSETTMRTRSALLARAEQSRHLAALPDLAMVTPRRHRLAGFLKGRRVLVAAAAAALLVVAGATTAVLEMPGGAHSGQTAQIAQSGQSAPTTAFSQAQPVTLVALASRVLAAPTQGNATLVLHTNAFPSGKSFTGADLYLDDGRYYYAAEQSGLRDAGKAGPQDYDLKPAIDAAASAAHAQPQEARTAFLKAIAPLWYQGATATQATQDNIIWCTALDALGAAYGRPEVMAGILNVLSTVADVKVESGSYNGQSVLNIVLTTPAHPSFAPTQEAIAKATGELRAKLEAEAAIAAKDPNVGADVETVTADDQTAALLLYKDQASDAGVTVTYHVSRVSAADYGIR
jgi:hypothetical protein